MLLLALVLLAPAGRAPAQDPDESRTGSVSASPAEALAAAGRELAADRPERAVEILEAAVAGHPDERPGSADLHALLGRALGTADRFGDAAHHLERAVELGRDDLRTLLFLGSAQWESRRIEAGEETLRRAARLAEEQGAGGGAAFLAHHELGRLLLWAGKPEEALAPLERAAELDPAAFDARLDLARALERSGRTERAAAAYRELVETAPHSPHARWGLGQTLMRLGRRQEAAEQLETYRELYAADQERTRNEQLVSAGLERARLRFEAGDLEEAERIVRGLPEAPATLEALARIRATGGDPAGAVAALERAVELAPDRDDLRGLLAEARLLMEERDRTGVEEGGDGS